MNILLHVCCSNCSLYPIKILRSGNHDFTGFWFNPNIQPYEEYQSRLASLKKLSNLWQVDILYNEKYEPEEYFKALNIAEDTLSYFDSDSPTSSKDFIIPPAPVRCKSCYQLRRETGSKLAEKYNVMFHMEDFRPFFRDAMNLAKELDLYRQKYCGCIFSREERFNKKGQRGKPA